jgi:AcrR family transcriptional regulator
MRRDADVTQVAPRELPRRERRRRHTHRRIIAAAMAEFDRVGVAQARVEHICRAADVTRPTFYAHFPSKEDVLLELQRRAANTIADEILARLAEAASLSQVIEALVEGLFAAAGSVSPRLRREIVSFDVRERRTALWEATPLFREIRRRFDAARARGEIAPSHDSRQVTHWILVTLLGFLVGDAPDLEATRDDALGVLQLVVKGLRCTETTTD